MSERLAQEAIVQGAGMLMPDDLARALADLPGWALTDDGKGIWREWSFRNFRQAAALANLAAWQAEAANHHPDIAFGWGRARVTYATHSAGGVTMNDLVMAARLSRAVD